MPRTTRSSRRRLPRWPRRLRLGRSDLGEPGGPGRQGCAELPVHALPAGLRESAGFRQCPNQRPGRGHEQASVLDGEVEGVAEQPPVGAHEAERTADRDVGPGAACDAPPDLLHRRAVRSTRRARSRPPAIRLGGTPLPLDRRSTRPDSCCTPMTQTPPGTTAIRSTVDFDPGIRRSRSRNTAPSERSSRMSPGVRSSSSPSAPARGCGMAASRRCLAGGRPSVPFKPNTPVRPAPRVKHDRARFGGLPA